MKKEKSYLIFVFVILVVIIGIVLVVNVFDFKFNLNNINKFFNRNKENIQLIEVDNLLNDDKFKLAGREYNLKYISESKGSCKISVEYPIFFGQDYVNAEIKKKILSYVDNFKLSAWEFCDADSFFDSSLNIRLRYYYETQNVMSVVFDYYDVFGGPHGLSQTISLNYDTKKNIQIHNIEEVYDINKAKLNNILKERLYPNDYHRYSNNDYIDCISDDSNYSFSLSKDRIYFYLGVCLYFGQADSELIMSIPNKLINELR